ncbi:MAG: tRNA (adenosine(37)-N6)-dimethylallyltransferase MiaA [Actinobacteria bacterium]|uniref:tRNA dimethylallyltransferase n=1 Tax=freshwater metagenome TaxID=449393 RepID=A0A6J6IKU4_9ZZZZ|nr:tRNA (adenosine(37)-N6)-dimethylallyltransferase MiaA [Actinomycetota bacterium]MTA21505.1 tRNA (adenosine(37)-N6)-dimethylallyltransferase MiaA [Actinomycetota bacterium]
MSQPLVIICGATATGKSSLAINLALEIGAEIINADSMQLYRGMDIGTAKVTVEERQGIPHHLLDILDVSQSASVASYQELARNKISEIWERGNPAIIVGGTGLYIKSIIDEMNFPDTDPAIRARLEADAELLGAAAIFMRLQEQDPEAAATIDSANIRRVIRALEVIEATGKPYSANLPEDVSARYPEAIHIGLEVSRESLAPRIQARVDHMWDQGFVAEVEELIKEGLLEGTTAHKAIGYSQIIALLNGEIDESSARESTVTATRQYVRRQETWFKRDRRINWLSEDQPHLQKVLERINS